jgi:glycosyltransferase involved in cell wall biosynthesis
VRIVIVSYYFPPFMNVGGFRALSWARLFLDRGHEVVIIHGDGLEADACCYFPEAAGREFRSLQIHNPRLAKGPTGTDSNASSSMGRKLLGELKDRIKGFVPILDAYGSWARAASRAADAEAKRMGGVDLIVSTSFPLSAHAVARRLKAKTGAFWVADFRDFYGQFDSTALRSLRPRTRRIQRFVRGIGTEADLVTTVSDKLATIVSKSVRAKRIEVIYNGYFEEHLPVLDGRKTERRILYMGSYNASEFTLKPLVEALLLLREEGFDLPLLSFAGGFIAQVEEVLSSAGLSHEFLSPVPNRESLRLQRDSAMLLLCDAMSGPGALLTKTFEYLAVRRPILVIARAESDLAHSIFASPSSGYLVSLEPEKIAAFIHDRFAKGDETHDDYYDAETIRAYSRERQAERLLSIIEEMRGYHAPD